MTAVSQSYPNYLGGLNEQPDELKKPGQLVEALNVIPDPVIGLTRRPGFELLGWKDRNGTPISRTKVDIEPSGTWFEIERTNDINTDYIYFGCVDADGEVRIFNQDGVVQLVKYSASSIAPHKEYYYNANKVWVYDDNGDLIKEYDVDGFDFVQDDPDDPDARGNIVGYFTHEPEQPLKYCVSKDNIVFTNPVVVPTLSKGRTPDAADKVRYYSFIDLKVIDTVNYKYQFKRFYGVEDTERYTVINDLDIENIDGLKSGAWENDLDMPLMTDAPDNGGWIFDLESDSGNEQDNAKVKVTFIGQVVQVQKSRKKIKNKVRYSANVEIIFGGDGFEKNQTITKTIKYEDKPDVDITFKVGKVSKFTGAESDTITPDLNGNTADEILAELGQKFIDVDIDVVRIVGNGLYLENGAPFSVSTSEPAVANVINSQKLDDDDVPLVRVTSVDELPVECYAGFIAQVTNSFDGEDDYYLRYTSESDPDEKGVDNETVHLRKADGYWEEIAKPYEQYNPNNSSLPHMISIAKETDREDFVFIVSPIDYAKRTAGTAKDNPSMFKEGSAITDVNYYKNRLFMLTNAGTVITSRAGEIENLFLNTATTTSIIDPIDVVANSNQRVSIHGSAVVNNSMVLFGDTEQYSLTTDSSVLTSDTVNVTKIANYTYAPLSEPIYLGTNLGFISKGLTRFYEMTNVYDRGPVDINERSQQIQAQFGQGFNTPVSSREQSMAVVYKKYLADGDFDTDLTRRSRDMYLYRFRQENSQESSQTSWTKWRVDHPICYVSLPKNEMFVVVRDTEGDERGCLLYKMDASTLGGLPASSIEDLTFVPTYLDGYYTDEDGKVQGEPFETRITFPTIYAQSKGNAPKSDVTANLTIHRVKLSTAAIGTYNLTIKRDGYDEYDLLVEQTPSDEYYANLNPLRGEHIETVPIYTRNKNLTLTMSTEYDAPLTLRSMTWEGDWNRPYYKSV